MLQDTWQPAADIVAITAAAAPACERKKWAKQADWDRDNMRTISTKLPIEAADELKAACQAAGVTRYTLVAHMLRQWMDTRKDIGEEEEQPWRSCR